MASAISLISSMATRQVLADLVAGFHQGSPLRVSVQSVGGVDAARRVRAGEAFDAVVLAADAIDQLIEAGCIVPGSRVDLVRSGVAVAVRTGAPRIDISSEDKLKQALLAARSLSYSTGPSGVQLAALFKRWGVAETLAPRIVQAPPGVPVGTLVAEGKAEIGFQQLSEMMSLPGIAVLGPLPPAIQIITTFSGAVAKTSKHPDAVRALLAFMASADADAAKRANGMEPA